MRAQRKIAMGAVMVSLAIALSACSTGDTTPAASTEALSDAAQSALDRAYAGYGSDLADLEAVTPKSDVNFYVMSCGEAAPTCHAPAAAMVAAAEELGWTGTIVDGKLSPDGFATAIRQATAAGADVLVPVGISCSAAAAAFQEAKAAGVVIVGGGGQNDCDSPVWDAERLWLPADEQPTPYGIFGAFGALQADYVYGKTNGDVNAVVVNLTSQGWGQLITDSFESELDSLGGGKVLVQVDVTDPEVADGSFAQKIVSAVLANPDANALIVPTDAYLVNGLAAALNQAGVAEKLVTVGAFGSEPALDMIRSGQPGITATVGDAQDWEAWGSVDTAVRVLAGQEPAYIGQTMQIVDADHNLPASGPFNGTVDWKKAFETSWGK
ncbi:substrate-binding domain-containing protein [Microbacterium sp. SORGH_AS_0862]|uniref:sugar ABC transporter substrate-binding protein n=1 Tax=Microbacterium sp. SORGH_AS_0862 TaxID=3041789 RepID=UPI00278E8226|nr:substrate-binding domain-containing protein [Microbacterium sp. SORGH_AS_0862]MDQ1204812.1 ribose transport system substrate-binding protein [Microbacterium sp. SORGH_AS_0862]